MAALQTDISARSASRSFASEFVLSLKNLFLPALCHKCGERILTEENLYFCETCWATIDLVREPKCPRCGRPHPRRPGFEAPESFVCLECAEQKSWVERTHAAALHAGVLRDAIHLLKYRRKRLIAVPLSRLILETVFKEIDAAAYDAIIPVPLHRSRLRRRGYNQSDLIARNLCAVLGATHLPILKRVKDTASFSMLGAQQRRNQIKDAFRTVPDANVKKKRLLLVDDVVTTGATTNECARMLRKAGAQSVDVVSVAAAKML
ncbi:ComF family protein [Candidatus Poribacteria bacterium]|nr:ComF family protein [Candidatus Poribacteria bacterium]